MTEPSTKTTTGHPRRWIILGILNLSLIMIVAGVSSLNLSLPSIQRALGATGVQLVWINAAYALVFAALLLPAGALGDRFGRRGALQLGLVIFLAGAVLATRSSSAEQIILWRCVMGVGAAFTMPATLSILTAVFPPEERSRAIAIWAGFAGAGGAIGLLSAGLLLEYFWWGSVFFVNIPIALVALTMVTLLVPTSRDTRQRPLDPVGGLLTASGLTGLVYGLIQGPEFGWSDPFVIGGFVAAVVLLTAWVLNARRQTDPMLDPALFAIPRFGLASLTITAAFAVMFGMFFGLAQYLQFVMGHSPLNTSLRVIPFAVGMIAVAPRGPRLVEHFGAGKVMGSGLLLAASGCIVMSLLSASSPYLHVLAGIIILSSGMAMTFPTATTAIVGSLPLDKAGVASAVNDTTREVGAAVGIALLGTLLSAGYRRDLGDTLDSLPLPAEALEASRDSVGAALHVARSAPGSAGETIATAARSAFTSGYSLTMIAGAAIMATIGVILIVRFPDSD